MIRQTQQSMCEVHIPGKHFMVSFFLEVHVKHLKAIANTPKFNTIASYYC